MKRIGSLISRYLITSIGPYFVLSWLLLSVILFVQQGSRYSDLFFNVNIPGNLIWQLTLALIPNVIAFTCPMAMLVGTIIGLTKMQGDSELVAIRASGVGNLQIALPIMLLGVLLSVFAFFVNLSGVPFAAGLVRNVALQTAIKKLESPLDPGSFNTDIAGYTIFVRGGDIETGRWKDIFIYNEDKSNGALRLITSKDGRIDTAGEVSELVLESANVITMPVKPGPGKYVSENIGDVRIAIRTSRGELISRLSRSEINPEELGLQQLSEYAANKEGKERVEAQILQNRRIILSITPFIFCILGTVIVLRLNRGGRNFGIILALAVLIGYYLLAFLGEQLARTGSISVTVGSLIPIGGSLLTVIWFAMSRRLSVLGHIADSVTGIASKLLSSKPKLQTRNLFVDITTGLRDFDIIRNLVKNFVLTVLFLSAIFVIFTAFELWKFAGTIDGGVWLLINYLTYLAPFMYLQIAPSAAMIATIATFAIKSRQNEIVTWIAAGQSIYRLLIPCFLLMLLLGGANWMIQESVLPRANRLQDSTRAIIRNRGVAPDQTGKAWVATDNYLYSFHSGDAGSASDNEKRSAQCQIGDLYNVSVYEIAANRTDLRSVYRADCGRWEAGKVTLTGKIEKIVLSDGKVVQSDIAAASVDERDDPFKEIRKKPAHLDSQGISKQIASAESEVEKRSLEVALQKKWSTLFLPLVLALFTTPFALSISQKGKAATISYAVGLWLLFTGTSSVFEQMGLGAQISPALAVWSPLAIFALIGVYLLTKVRT